jgi:hypothetical protein
VHCAAVGEALGRMHVAGFSFDRHHVNERGPAWWFRAARELGDLLDAENRRILDEELAYQKGFRGIELPRGTVHADLFRDNVLFEGERLAGMIDFYYACDDCLLYDVAITVNDWCTATDGSLEPERSRALLDANGFLTGAAQTGGEWNVRARFPEKSAVLAFRDDLVADGLDIDVRTITGDKEDAAQFGVTDPQREVLLLALNRGYFTVPRDASLSDLAADLDISSQAASERLRRGTRTLVENTLASPERPLVGSAPE